MDEAAKMETHHLSSAAAFVEGGIQDACDDTCSICLEAFCESDPSTVTSCKHEFHLQCILEWCQRSAQCPMCWQSISLKDPISQELLDAVERERIMRSNQTQNAAIFRHPMLGDFQLQHLPVGADAMELEERIIQHLAAAAAMGRAHHARREGQRGRSAAQGHPQVLVFSRHTDTSSTDSAGANSLPRVETEHAPANVAASPSALPTSMVEEAPPQSPYLTPVRADQVPSGTSVPTANTPVLSNNRVVCSAGQSTPVNQDTAGPSDFQSLSESFKARLHAVSMRYKESITKSTRGWKERLFSRSTSGADLGSEVRREVNAETATVSHMMESLDIRESRCSSPHNMEGRSVTEPINERTPENHIVTLPNENIESASSSTTPGPN